MQKPSQFNVREIDRVIRCLARNRRTDVDGLWVLGTEDVKIFSTTDTSYHGFPYLKSGKGDNINMFHFTGSIMSMHEKQSITVDSALTAEEVSGHLHVHRVLSLRYFYTELGYPRSPLKLYKDNEPFMKTI